MSDQGGSEKPGSGAVLGAKVLRYSGIQGALLVTSNLLTFASVVVVAFFLGPAEFGRFGLLLFLSGLLSTLFNLATKQGTFKRVFGMDDEDDDDDDEESAADAGGDRRSLGTGLWLTVIVSIVGTLIVIAAAEPIANLLLGGDSDRELIAFAAIGGGLSAIFRLTSLVLWLERRPGAHVAVEVARPLLILVAVVAFVAAGAGIEGAIAGTALGSAIAVAVAVFMLRGSLDPRPSLAEAGLIWRRGAPRIPVVLSMWTISNADIFLLSRFVTDADVGVYQLASRTGIVVALLPGAFRVAMRPLRKSLSFKAVQDEYGRATARGQQLTYFFLLCIVALFGATLAAEVLAHLAPSGYADAAPLVPLVALALMGPSIMRSVSQAVSIPNKRTTFIVGAVVAALVFIGTALFLIGELGLAGAPIAMLIGFSVPSLFMLTRSQFGDHPVEIEYLKLAGATLLAGAIGAAYALLVPDNVVVQIIPALAAFAGYIALLPAIGIVPRRHWAAFKQIAKAQFGKGGGKFDPARAIGGLGDADRVALRIAIVKGKPVDQILERLAGRGLSPNGGASAGSPGGDGGAFVVGALRRAAESGGTPIREGKKAARRWGSPEERDAEIAGYLFPEGTVAQRDSTMRKLLAEGVRSDELMELEAILNALENAPRKVWKERG
ncbi:MAG: lipopolysaccharide biosynthesis protein [Solirubrobacterales bacterium]